MTHLHLLDHLCPQPLHGMHDPGTGPHPQPSEECVDVGLVLSKGWCKRVREDERGSLGLWKGEV